MVECETREGSFRWLNIFRSGGWLDRSGFYQPRSFDQFLDPTQPRSLPGRIWKGVRTQELRDMRFVWWCIWYFFYILFGVLATFTAIGGTLMQVLGVYSADICGVTTDHWIDPFRPGVTAMISMNSTLMIRDAQTYWKPCAITAIAFMSFVSFVGWWYQRRLRDLFMDLVSKIDQDRYARRNWGETWSMDWDSARQREAERQ